MTSLEPDVTLPSSKNEAPSYAFKDLFTAKKTLIFVLQSHVSTFLYVPFNVIFLASVTLKIYIVMNYRYIVGKGEGEEGPVKVSS